MTVHVAFPVLSATLQLHLEKGRQWSVVEHLVLVAIQEKSSTALEVAQRGRLPKRLVMEALIRLMRAGWVELLAAKDGTISFRATSAGVKAAQEDTLPRFTRLTKRRASFAIDRITGSVFRARELVLYTPQRLSKLKERDKVLELEASFDTPSTSYDEIMSVLLDEDETYRSMDATGARPVDRFAVVTVRGSEIDGLPERPPSALVRAILDRTEKEGVTAAPAHLPQATAPVEEKEIVQRAKDIVFEARDLFLGGDAHLKLFEELLRRARNWIIVHSTFINAERFKTFVPLLNDAARRGARIDILWGQSTNPDGGNRTEQEVSVCRSMLETELVQERVRLHGFSTNSHAKLIIADDGAGSWSAVVGSCNWLNTDFKGLEASARLRDPQIVADVAGQLGELAAGNSGHWTPLRADLAGLAVNLRRDARRLSGRRAKAQLVLGAYHNDYMRQARDDAENRIIVASHRLSTKASTLILDPAREAARVNEIEVALYYGLPSKIDAGAASELVRNAASGGMKLRQIFDPRLHAKVLAWDDNFAVVTSQNWLSADPGDSSLRSEIGVFIEAAGMARQVGDYLSLTLTGA